MRVLTIAIALLMTFGQPCASAAEPGPKEAAREHARRAQVAYNLSHYDEAVTEYEAAYRLVYDPLLLYNIAQCHRNAGHSDKALATYRAFLREASPDAPQRDVAMKRIHDLETSTTHIPPPAPASGKQMPPMPAPPSPSPMGAVMAETDVQHDGGTTGETSPFYQRGWFWVAVASVAAAAVGVAVLTSGGDDHHVSNCGAGINVCVGIPK